MEISGTAVSWVTSMAVLCLLLIVVLVLAILQSFWATTKLSRALVVGCLAVLSRLIFSDAEAIHMGYTFLADLVLGSVALLASSYITTILQLLEIKLLSWRKEIGMRARLCALGGFGHLFLLLSLFFLFYSIAFIKLD